MPLLSIMIPTHNRPFFFQRAYTATKPLLSDPRVEVVVANSSSSPCSYREPFHVSSPGVSREENYLNGVQACRGDFTLIYEDDDILLASVLVRWLNSIINKHSAYVFPLVNLFKKTSFPSEVQLTGEFLQWFPAHCKDFQWGQIITPTDSLRDSMKKWWNNPNAHDIPQSDTAVTLLSVYHGNLSVSFQQEQLLYVGRHSDNYSWGNKGRQRDAASRCAELIAEHIPLYRENKQLFATLHSNLLPD